jgi:hypothetical protein
VICFDQPRRIRPGRCGRGRWPGFSWTASWLRVGRARGRSVRPSDGC